MNYKDILKKYKESPEEIKWYFQDLPKLINKNFTYELCIAYCFMQLETARLVTLYCGIKRKYKTDTDVTWKILDANEITWSNFKEYYSMIFGQKYDSNLHKQIDFAINVRNKIIHGGNIKEKEKLKCICDIIEFASNFNECINSIAGFKPIGKLIGVFGAPKNALDGDVTRMVMKGLGFSA